MMRIFSIVIVSISLIFTIGCLFFGKQITNTNDLISKYDTIANMVSSGEIDVESNGRATLPNAYKNLSDTGVFCIVEFKGETALYFFIYRGILDESKGYVYITKKLSYLDYIDTNEYVASPDFNVIKKLADNLYLCTTG